MTQSTRPPAGARISDTAAGVLHAGIDAIDKGTQFAADAVDKIGKTGRELRGNASDLLGQRAAATRRYVTGKPWKSVAIAALAGAAATALAVAALRKPRGE
jgi:ElaB/YqjD/DUF883 family membrane-anchored ribosome-binding protein